jgi:hypothetical protein
MVANDSMISGGTMEQLSRIETALSELSAEMLSENLELIQRAIRSLSAIRHSMQKAGSGGEVDSALASLDLTALSRHPTVSKH